MQQRAFLSTRLLRLAAAVCAALACSGAAAQAGGAGGLDWTFGGFGTIAATHASTTKADFTSSIMKSSGAGWSKRWSPHVDSRLGAQLDVVSGTQWSAVIQAVSEQRSDGSYRPVLEWANIKYQVTPDLSLRAGRIALPMFLAADYRKIGYAYPWIRTPVEVYDAIPLSSSDGVDASYRWNHGVFKNVTQAFYGSTGKPLWDGATLKAHGINGLTHTTGYRDASVRVSVLKADVDIDLARHLFDAYRQFGAPGAALGQRFDVAHRRVTALSAGVNYDPGQWFAMGELGRITTSSYLGDTWTAYASAGYRFGAVTAYLVYAGVDPSSATADPGLALDGMAPAQAQAGAFLNGQLNELLASAAVQSTASAGLRWDVKPGLSLTLQYDRVRPGAGSRGTLIKLQPGFESGRPLHLASAALDFVF